MIEPGLTLWSCLDIAVSCRRDGREGCTTADRDHSDPDAQQAAGDHLPEPGGDLGVGRTALAVDQLTG